ncbi:ETX/MTX2 family pore-forming toxin [Hymenobacter sp. BT523]|uniref:ETX/MTX2 family pore-forming toxin n=1 Tax=Hymenobacter sp. BT523 TaxID=2795725 RepID=UPI0018ED27DD|nr:ETX/MTX2 family pore-forming toxin [Hymenobacter sp. BT523]MBJ6110772.1 ETX/MTX2 family pore-forming toxin [Hymenobacter sp. BT523]
MNSLQQITDAWGNWYSSQHGTSCRFTASTNYGSQSFLDNYHQYQTNVQVQDIVYTSNTPPVGGSEVAYQLWYDNGTSVQQQNTFQETQTSQQSFTWSITESLSVGIEISATEGVPAVASSSQKVTVTLGLSSTQGQTKTNTQTWSVNSPINVPANSSVKADMVISTQSYDVNFTQAVLLQGSVAIWNNDKVNGHWLWFIPIQSVFQDCLDHNIIDTSGYSIVSGGVTTQATGVFQGSQGVSVGVTAKQYPLRSSAASAKAAAPQALEPVAEASMSPILAVAAEGVEA